MSTNGMTPLDRVIHAERNEYHECDWKVWGITVEEAAAELAQLRADLQAAQDAEKHWQEMAQAELDTANRLRAKEERLDQLQEGVSEMRAAIETEFDSTIETQKNNIKQLIELIERQFDDITALRADLQAAQERSAEQARQLEEAREIIESCASLDRYVSDGGIEDARAWLAANTPQPQEQSA